MAKTRTLKREPGSFELTGNGHWTKAGAESDGRVVKGALLSGRTLKLTIETGPDSYGVTLTSMDREYFAGQWQCKDGSYGEVNGTLHPAKVGYFFFGKWLEEGVYYFWWFTLVRGEGFNEDE